MILKYCLLAVALTGVCCFAPPALAQSANTPETKKPSAPQDIKPGELDLEILRDVERRNKQLDEREKSLDKKEQKLKLLEADIEKQLAEFKALQVKIEESIALRSDLEIKAVKRLAKTYASMPPEAAALLIQQLDPPIAIRTLAAMKERAAGRILAVIPPDQATKLSEGLVVKR